VNTCPVFDSELNLISYDGNHLTSAGAMLLGNKLLTHQGVIDTLSVK